MFDFKIHIIGYYTSAKQNMEEETERIEEAKELAVLLGRTFSTINTTIIKDKKFVEALSSNTVFIFNDEQRNLYAYYPRKGIARLTNVVYNRNNINPAPLEVKGWFVPGSFLTVGHAKSNAKTHSEQKSQKTFSVVRLSGEVDKYPISELRITNVRSDILLFFGKKTLPLNISEEKRVTFTLLYKLIAHPWFYLEEYETSDDCGDCDGYDYSNCDMNRCKNDCENCGGRRHICNNSCFNYRYNVALKIRYTDDCYGAIDKVRPYIEQITKPHSNNWKDIIEKHDTEISKVERSCGYLYFANAGYPGEVSSFLSDCSAMRELINYRTTENEPKIIVEIRAAGKTLSKIFKRSEASARGTHGGFLWLFDTGGTIEFDGYNYIDDQVQKYELRLKNSDKFPKFVDDINDKLVSKIIVGPSDDNEKFEIIGLIRSV